MPCNNQLLMVHQSYLAYDPLPPFPLCSLPKSNHILESETLHVYLLNHERWKAP